MPNPVETFLTSIGVPAEDIPNIIGVPEDQHDKFDPKPYAEKVKGNFTKQLQNDPNFFSDLTLEKLPAEVIKKVETAQFFRANNIMKGKLMKGLGLTDSDIADLNEDQKEKLESFVSAVAEKFVKTKSGDKQVQADLIEARKKLETFDGLEEKLKTKFQTESDTKINSAIFNAAMLSDLAQIPGLKIPAADIAAAAKSALESKYSFERVGDYNIELRQKSNPSMKVLKNGTSHELSLKDALTEIATDRGWVSDVEDDDPEKGKTGSGKVIIKPSGGKLKMVAPHLQDKISKKIASEQ